ncbi:protein FAM131C isoform X2 [Chiloscyllium punctatum]|uniref:protein FAM131C isoform X2 n=1 Tax=Chiloscyllium punctatum TaxID=137246 RepID=UPI003B64268F
MHDLYGKNIAASRKVKIVFRFAKTEILTNTCEYPSKANGVSQVPNNGVAQEKREFAPPVEDQGVCKDRTDFCWDPIVQNCFGSTNVIFTGSKQTLNGYDITALARSSLVGLVQTVKDHITKPTAMARGRVAHLIEWKGWGAHGRGSNTCSMDDVHYSNLTDELKEARFAAGVAEQFAITEATLSAWSSLDAEEVICGSSPSNTVDYLNTDEVYLEDQLSSGSQGFYYSLNVEGSCTVITPVSSYVASLAGEPLQTDMAPTPSSHSGTLTETLPTHNLPNCSSLPATTSCGAELQRTQQSPLHQSHSSNSSSLMEDDVFYN